jgi:hypothetical protein
MWIVAGSERTYMNGCGNELVSKSACIDDDDDHLAYQDAAAYGYDNSNDKFAPAANGG